MKNGGNLYRILGIADFSTEAQVAKAYRKLAITSHPDTNPNAKPEEFHRLLDAYETLNNPEKKAIYDDRLRRGDETTTAEFYKAHDGKDDQWLTPADIRRQENRGVDPRDKRHWTAAQKEAFRKKNLDENPYETLGKRAKKNLKKRRKAWDYFLKTGKGRKRKKKRKVEAKNQENVL